MARTSRNSIITSFFHVITQGINKSYIFQEKNEIEYYIKSINKLKEKYNIKVIAYCIMNNHAHMLINVENIENLSKFMQCLNTKYAKYYNKKYNRVGYVFRNRYKSEGIYTEKHLYNCIHYIYNNPVKAGICQYPSEYPYSNYKENHFIENEFEIDYDYDFIDIDNEERGLHEIIKKYMLKNNFKHINDIIKNKEELKNLVFYLKNNKKISFRKMEKEIGISREKLRNLIK